MRNPLNIMRIRNNHAKNVLSREISATHNVYAKDARIDAKTHHVRGHYGWDLEAADETPIYAITSGTITSTWHDPSMKNYGNQIQLGFTYAGTNYTAFYAHLSLILVAPMANVVEGQIIGFTGHTGNARNLPVNQRHLHFEIRTMHGKGSHGSIDPATLLGGSMLVCQ